MITYVEHYLVSSLWGVDIIDSTMIKKIELVTDASIIAQDVIVGEHYTRACMLTDAAMAQIEDALLAARHDQQDDAVQIRIDKSLSLLSRITAN